jgi:hypothetical protein
MATTLKSVRHDVQNVLDYLLQAELATYVNPAVVHDVERRVSWPNRGVVGPLLSTIDHPDIDQYAAWVSAGAYSAVLRDASLLQISYEVYRGEITGHRLAYVPCPYDVDQTLLQEGYRVIDILDLYRGNESALRTPLRFDFDPGNAAEGHPAAHLTLNSRHCRIACVAPLHVLRFADFVYRNFYPRLWAAHRNYFAAASWRHLDAPQTEAPPRGVAHVMWDTNASAAGAAQ